MTLLEIGGKILWTKRYLNIQPSIRGSLRFFEPFLTYCNQTFDPPLPSNLDLNLVVSDASIVVNFRTLHLINPNAPTSFTSDALSGLSLRQRLGLAAKLPDHDESDRAFRYRDQDVRVREKARVESQDPSLMALMAKLSALEHGVRVARRALGAVMGSDESEEE